MKGRQSTGVGQTKKSGVAGDSRTRPTARQSSTGNSGGKPESASALMSGRGSTKKRISSTSDLLDSIVAKPLGSACGLPFYLLAWITYLILSPFYRKSSLKLYNPTLEMREALRSMLNAPIYIPLFLIVSLGALFMGLGYFVTIPYRLIRYIQVVPQRRQTLHNAPGSKLIKVASFLYSPKIVENVFMPLVHDWRLEYFEAFNNKNRWKARWISVRYRWAFFEVIVISKVLSLLKAIRRSE